MPAETIKLTIKGMDELLARMGGLKEDMDKALDETVRNWGPFWFDATQQACPVDKGILVQSGNYEIVEEGGRLVVRVTYTAPYAKPVEYGWKRTKPIVPGPGKQALSWEGNKKGRLLAGAKPSQGNRITVAKVVTPASFKGISYVRVPLQRARRFLDNFWSDAWNKQKEAT